MKRAISPVLKHLNGWTQLPSGKLCVCCGMHTWWCCTATVWVLPKATERSVGRVRGRVNCSGGGLRRMDTRELIAFFSSARTRWRRSRRRVIVTHSNKRNCWAHYGFQLFCRHPPLTWGNQREKRNLLAFQGSKVSNGTFTHQTMCNKWSCQITNLSSNFSWDISWCCRLWSP